MIDRLAANGIDLTKMPIEVAPIAHYHMGGIVADAQMQTGLPGLFAAGKRSVAPMALTGFPVTLLLKHSCLAAVLAAAPPTMSSA